MEPHLHSLRTVNAFEQAFCVQLFPAGALRPRRMDCLWRDGAMSAYRANFPTHPGWRAIAALPSSLGVIPIRASAPSSGLSETSCEEALS